MKRTTRSFAASAAGKVVVLQEQKKVRMERATLQSNEAAAKRRGLKAAACLCCGNRGTSVCEGCNA